MAIFDLKAFETTPLNHDPFDYMIVPNFVRGEALAALHRDYPRIAKPGSFPVSELEFGPGFQAMLDEFGSPEMRDAFERKFDIDLAGRPLTATVRGRCQQKDGRIHTDSKSKIITVLIYLNSKWENPGGQLRLLRGPDDLENYFAEVPPNEGTLLAFRRSDNSFHGHKPFVGERRVIQFNWVTDAGTAWRERVRHRISAWLKGSDAYA
jgi:SM-20-related protein